MKQRTRKNLKVIYKDTSFEIYPLGITISLDTFKNYIFKDFLNFSQISSKLTELCGQSFRSALVRDIFNHYGLILDDLTKDKIQQLKAELRKATNLKKYGVTNSLQREGMKKHTAQVKLERYGDALYNNIEKNKQTCLERYGVSNVSSLPKVRAKVAQTCLEKYGGKAPACSKEIMNKMRQTNLEKYGVEDYSLTEDFVRNLKKYNLETYGYESYTQTEELKENAIGQIWGAGSKKYLWTASKSN